MFLGHSITRGSMRDCVLNILYHSQYPICISTEHADQFVDHPWRDGVTAAAEEIPGTQLSFRYNNDTQVYVEVAISRFFQTHYCNSTDQLQEPTHLTRRRPARPSLPPHTRTRMDPLPNETASMYTTIINNGMQVCQCMRTLDNRPFPA